ncbi:hypothetical protein TSUD_281130 [Trifolium subterraneum]|uniref:USP domain-containing protein n=1 Tax=Trifolium subterraneum TaxID=3900 RepID=A0A2Z6PFV0_TRISU|nr:hypothetical protein TSUD_281130 [Trifolium subterraneum]
MHSTLYMSLDPHVFTLVLKSCTTLNLPHLATSIHSHLIKSSFLSNNPFLSSSLLNFYGNCVSLKYAHQLFDETPQRNVIIWNSIISLYSRSQHITTAMNLFNLMNVPANESTFNPIIAALSLSNQNNASFKAINFYRKMIELRLKPSLITLLALLPASVSIAALNLIKEIHAAIAVAKISRTDDVLATVTVSCGGYVLDMISLWEWMGLNSLLAANRGRCVLAFALLVKRLGDHPTFQQQGGSQTCADKLIDISHVIRLILMYGRLENCIDSLHNGLGVLEYFYVSVNTDRSSHSSVHPMGNELELVSSEPRRSSVSIAGERAGLKNLGNTCYMDNSLGITGELALAFGKRIGLD